MATDRLAPPNASPRQIDVHKGVSMFETEEQARQLASELRKRYDYIAVVAVPEAFEPIVKGNGWGITTCTPRRMT